MIFESNTKEISNIEYVYMKGTQILSKNSIQFSSTTNFRINDQY